MFVPPPIGVVCHICGRQYGTKSIEIHLKTCAEMFEVAEAQKPKRERRPVPQAPELPFSEGDFPTKAAYLEARNAIMFEVYNSHALERCNHCGRTFLSDRLVVHQRGCTAENPYRSAHSPKLGSQSPKLGSPITSPRIVGSPVVVPSFLPPLTTVKETTVTAPQQVPGQPKWTPRSIGSAPSASNIQPGSQGPITIPTPPSWTRNMASPRSTRIRASDTPVPVGRSASDISTSTAASSASSTNINSPSSNKPEAKLMSPRKRSPIVETSLPSVSSVSAVSDYSPGFWQKIAGAVKQTTGSPAVAASASGSPMKASPRQRYGDEGPSVGGAAAGGAEAGLTSPTSTVSPSEKTAFLAVSPRSLTSTTMKLRVDSLEQAAMQMLREAAEMRAFMHAVAAAQSPRNTYGSYS